MSHHELRTEKNCLNCGHSVEERFCTFCGQENIEPRQTFGHLVTHFFEDITHYEGKFWGTMRYLFFKPAFLSKAFLAGKRSSYLPPVRLYIFVSFITFFLPELIPVPAEPHESVAHSEVLKAKPDSIMSKPFASDTMMHIASVDSADAPIQGTIPEQEDYAHKAQNGTGSLGYASEKGFRLPTSYGTLEELDSTTLVLKGTADEIGWIEYLYHKRAIELLHTHYTPKEQLRIFAEGLRHNFPKALFIYMPLFALVLWLFHSGKKWIFYDHAIFTLHYFSFVLLAFMMLRLLYHIAEWVGYWTPAYELIGICLTVLMSLIFLSYPVYLYIAHKRMYGETGGVSFLKTTGILLINMVLFSTIFILLIAVTVFTMH
jgi:hypothetical protein